MNISGGRVGAGFKVFDQSVVNITGGAFGDGFGVMGVGAATIHGEQFRINGQPIPHLESIGQQTRLSLPTGAVLSGVVQDGTPFAFTFDEGDFPLSGGVMLRVVAAEPVGPTNITGSTGPVPLGIRQGQTLTVDAGGMVGDHFNAGAGSRVVVQQGGTVGANFEALGATVDVQGGVIGDDMDAFVGARVSISGGGVGERFAAYPGSEVVLSGGEIGDDFSAKEGSIVRIAGGTVGEQFTAEFGSELHISGGEIGESFESSSAKVIMSGGRLARAWFPNGDELVISNGQIGANATFSTNTLQISGGSFGAAARLDADSAAIRGGVFGPRTRVESGLVQISGGQFGDGFELNGGQVAITGGRFEDVIANSSASVDGGEFFDDFVVRNFRHVEVDGGTMHQLQLEHGGIAWIRGGQQLRITAADQAEVDVFVRDFSIDGVPLQGLLFGEALPITRRDVTLRGTLADGSPFTYELNTQFEVGEDFFDELAQLRVILVHPGDFNVDGAVDAADYVVWRKTNGTQGGYNAWRANFGSTAAGSGSSIVSAPEPASGLMLILAATAVGWRRHKWPSSRHKRRLA